MFSCCETFMALPYHYTLLKGSVACGTKEQYFLACPYCISKKGIILFVWFFYNLNLYYLAFQERQQKLKAKVSQLEKHITLIQKESVSHLQARLKEVKIPRRNWLQNNYSYWNLTLFDDSLENNFWVFKCWMKHHCLWKYM